MTAESLARLTTDDAGRGRLPCMALLIAPPSFIVAPDDPRYDDARRAWNLAADQHPAAVAQVESADDIGLAVRHARANGLKVTAQGTGHGALSLGDLSDTLLIRTDRMRGVEIDVERRVARVEAGAQWQDVVPVAAQHGLAALHGSAPDVGVVGYTLGGGLSFYGRRYGTAASRMLAVDLVTAGGEHVRASRKENADLFRALQGGGGAFGIVTHMEFELFPPGPIQAGHLFFPLERGREVFKAWAAIAPSFPRNATTIVRALRVPDIDGPPPEMRGKEFAFVESIVLGSPEEANALLAPIRELGPMLDTMNTVAIQDLQHLHMDPPEPVPGAGDHWTLPELSDAAVDTMFDTFGPSIMMFEIRLGGEAVAELGGPYIFFGGGMAATPEMGAAVLADLATMRDAVTPYRGTKLYANFVEHVGVAADEVWDADTLARLRGVKAAVDPANLIRSNHPLA
jgi:FAD/FMN-containing dehydrogenase